MGNKTSKGRALTEEEEVEANLCFNGARALRERRWKKENTRVLRVPADFITIQAAVDSAGNGDVIDVKGDHREQVVVCSKEVEIVGDGRASVLWGGEGDTVQVTAGACSIAGLVVKQDGQNGFSAVAIGKDEDDTSQPCEVTIEDCTVTSMTGDGIRIQGMRSHAKLRRCRVIGCEFTGIVAAQATQVEIFDTFVIGCDEYGIAAFDTAVIRLQGNNVLRDNRRKAINVEAQASVESDQMNIIRTKSIPRPTSFLG